MGAPGSALKPGSVQTGVGVKVGGARRPKGRLGSPESSGNALLCQSLVSQDWEEAQRVWHEHSPDPRLEERQETVRVMSPGLEPKR